MTGRGLTFYKQHFFFSNLLVRFLLGFDQYRSRNQQLFLVSTIIVYTLPLIVHQFYQLFTSEFQFQLAISVLQRTFAPLCFLCFYSISYYKFMKTNKIMSYLKSYYNQLSDDIEMNIIEKYNKKNKLYAYFIIGIFNIYIIFMILPSILNIFLYQFGTLDYVQLTLPYYVNHVLNAWLYYFLLIYQIIAIYILTIIACSCFSFYLILVQHACCLFSIIVWKINEPFKNHQKYVYESSYYGTQREEFDWIVDVINRFVEVMDLINLINTYEMFYFILILFALILIILDFLYMFQLEANMRNIHELTDCIIYSTGSIFLTYLNFYLGQTLIDNSNAAYKELCQVPYYSLSIKTQKLLLFVITRSGKPSMLSIGGMFVSSHEVFFKMMQKAFSFAMVYYSIQ